MKRGIKITLAVIEGLIDALPRLIQAVVDMIPKIVKGIIDNLPQIIEAGIQIVGALILGLAKAAWELVKAAAKLGIDFIKGIWEGIKSAATWLWDKVTGFFDGLVNGVKDLLGIHSPSTVFAEIGKNMGLGLAGGIGSSVALVDRAMDRLNASVGGVKADLAVNGMGKAHRPGTA